MTTRNAAFQQWSSLLTNRTKRLRAGEFLVQGVRPISQAVEQGWTIRALLKDSQSNCSSWAQKLWDSTATDHVLVSSDLMRELGQKTDGPPELVAVVEMPRDDPSRISPTPWPLIVVFDRPTNPGNIGTLIRSIDAFGGSALIVTGHAADPYDPKSVRASTGSLFHVPVIRAQSPVDVVEWVSRQEEHGISFTIIGTDEDGDLDIRSADFLQPVLLVVGNETTGLTAAWRDRCDLIVKIPMFGAASSLNAAAAGSIAVYEVMRQRTLN